MTKLFAAVAFALVATSTTTSAAPPQNTSLRGRRTEAMEYQAMMAGVTPQCFIENGWDYVGNDLSAVLGRVDECCDKCYKLRGCEAWSWTDFNGGTCWLKEKGENVQRNPNAKAGLLITGAKPTCEIVQDYDLNGNDVGNVKSDKAENCCGICQGFPGCRSFSWSDYNDGTCWLKGIYNGDLVAKPGVKSGIAFPIGDSVPQCASALADTDFVGNDIGSQTNIFHPGRCCELCRATGNCRAYTWTMDNGGTCYMKSKTGEKIFKQGAASVTVWPNVEEKCTLLKDRDFAGQDISNVQSASADQCCTQCRQATGCKAWTWTNYNGGTCWFKRGNAFSVSKAGAVAGTL